MSGIFIVSLYINILLILLVLTTFIPKLIRRYKEDKKQRETQEVTRIHKIVDEYLESLRNE